MNHTPTPWNHIDGNIYQSDSEFEIKVAKANTFSNAQFIVKCVNSHDELVTALRALVNETNRLNMFRGTINFAKQALKKAQAI